MRLDTIGSMMNGGKIELLSGGGNVLAVLKLSNPAAADAADGVLVLNKITEEDAALAQGRVETARIVAANGDEILSCDCGDERSDAVIKLTGGAQINRGGPVRINSFRLSMP